ncbi:hypothetical protein [Sphingobacterium paludis]|uniref:Uncharacterized protein n=1 Tax=Sphingobacterium paludis TaxID=1476465 RepID=A0A4R7CQM7_9SPHI|nr:hypothetical protein [Sphingobacterium paludis]TDS07464.1 hypothetical protein B0I21_11410 [Sphingobacterium paludis]
MNKIYLFTLLLSIFWLSSCTKTEGLEPLPQDKITVFKVVNLPDENVIYGAVDNQKNTITVYIPYYYSLLVIDPEIEVSNGAQIDGEIWPVLVEEKEKTYTVIAANGSKRTYTLIIESQNTPSFEAAWVSASTFSLRKAPFTSLVGIQGNFGHTNTAATGIILVNQETGERVTMPVLNSLKPDIQGFYVLINEGNIDAHRIPADTKAGIYDVEVRNLNHVYQLKEPLNIRYVQPNPHIPLAGVQVQKNADWKIGPALGTVFLNPKAAKVTLDNKDYPLTIKSHSRTELVITFPDDLPVGTFPNVNITFEFEGWNTVSKPTTFMVSAT